jgi:hypothetical protein
LQFGKVDFLFKQAKANPAGEHVGEINDQNLFDGIRTEYGG